MARHAQAENVYISLEHKENSITVQVEDDGVGFDLTQGFSSNTPKQSMGLLGIKERTELLGGTLVIDTKPGGGTRVLVEVPVDWEQIDG